MSPRTAAGRCRGSKKLVGGLQGVFASDAATVDVNLSVVASVTVAGHHVCPTRDQD